MKKKYIERKYIKQRYTKVKNIKKNLFLDFSIILPLLLYSLFFFPYQFQSQIFGRFGGVA